MEGHRRTDPEKGMATRHGGDGNDNISRLFSPNFKDSILQLNLLWQTDGLIQVLGAPITCTAPSGSDHNFFMSRTNRKESVSIECHRQ